MENFKVIAFTHKSLQLDLIGKLHLSPDEQNTVLEALKLNFGFNEMLFLSTCNRVELFIKTDLDLDLNLIKAICSFINSRFTPEELNEIASQSAVFVGPKAVEHVLKVASSLESLVVGEREIITQIRKAYEFCHQIGTTGDFLRLLINHTIETAKEIFTNTNIAKNPVSVASLAYRALREQGIKNDARILFVGSGQTNTVLASYFQKHQYGNFTVFNRSLSNAEKLAKVLHGKAFELNHIQKFDEGFDVLVVCTSSSETIITPDIYQSLLNNETSKKIIIDLGIPANVDANVAAQSQVNYIDITSLKAQAEANLQLRKAEIYRCDEIIQQKILAFDALYAERRIELAFGQIPKQVKAFKDLAMNEVFAKELNSLDANSKEVLDKVLSYMEKKYNAVAIKTAKEVFLSKN
ncbi:MAG: glutamyl-tRNA reductase [Bacteroidota bacterium]